MSEGVGVGWIALGLVLLAFFAWYFWHAATSFIHHARTIVDFVDTRSERLRRRLEFEAIHGRPPLWYRLVQRLFILLVIAGATALVWTKFRSA